MTLEKKEFVIEKKFYRFTVEDGIIVLRYQDGSVLDLQTVKEAIDDRFSITAGISMPLLIEGKVRYATKSAKEYASTPESQVELTAAAFYFPNPVLATMANFYVTLMVKKVIPLKIFSDRQKAINWLKEQSI